LMNGSERAKFNPVLQQLNMKRLWKNIKTTANVYMCMWMWQTRQCTRLSAYQI
jgi:hypothetical protein